MARTAKNEDSQPAEETPNLAGDPAAQQAALEKHQAEADERNTAYAEALAKHAEETAALNREIEAMRAELDAKRREAVAAADAAGAQISAQHDNAAQRFAALNTQDAPSAPQSRDLAPPATQQVTKFRLGANGELEAITSDVGPDSMVINQTQRPGGMYMVNGRLVDANGRPLAGGKAPAPEMPTDFETMPGAVPPTGN